MPEMPAIKTERLVLKKMQASDRERLVNLIGDFEVAQHLGRVPHPYTLEDADRWLAMSGDDTLSLNIFLDGDLIGGVGLSQGEDSAWELGYWLGADYWHRGFATEAVRGLLDHAGPGLQAATIKARVHKGNAASARVLEKTGFTIVGEEEAFSLSRQESVPCFNLVLAPAL